MRPILSLLILLSTFALSPAQHLVLDHTWTLFEIGEGYYDVEVSMIYNDVFGITGHNYVKGNILCGIWFKEEGLTPPEEVNGLQVSFYEKTDFGYYAVFDEQDYNITEPTTVLVLYNADRRVTKQYLLSDVFSNGRVIDFRYSNGLFFLALGNEKAYTEFGYLSYQIYCFDIEADDIVWRTEYERCYNQLEVLDKYVVSGFGGSGIDDFVYLIDRSTGVTLDRAPVASLPQYIEATKSQDTIYVSDYNSVIYRFLVLDRCVQVTGNGVRLRRGPSTRDAVFADEKGRPIYPRYGDNLAYLGESDDFYKVRFRQQELYISKRFAQLLEGPSEKNMLVSLWQEEAKRQGLSVAAPVMVMSIDLDKDGIDERVCKDANDQMAVFTAKDRHYRLIVSDNEDNLQFYPKIGALHTSHSLSTGYEAESIYLLKNSELQATYLRENDTYTKSIGQDAPTESSSDDFAFQRSRLLTTQPLDLSSSFDL